MVLPNSVTTLHSFVSIMDKTAPEPVFGLMKTATAGINLKKKSHTCAETAGSFPKSA